jgi:hypothetical protein
VVRGVVSAEKATTSNAFAQLSSVRTDAKVVWVDLPQVSENSLNELAQLHGGMGSLDLAITSDL